MGFLNKDGNIYTSAKDDGTGKPITSVELYAQDSLGNKFPVEVDGVGNLKMVSKLDLTTLVENGSVYIVHHEYTISSLGTIYMQYEFGDKKVYGLSRNVSATGGLIMKLWENPSRTSGNQLPLLPPTNLNRMIQGLQSSATFYINPTNVNTGGATLVAYDRIFSAGKGNPTGLTGGGLARILKENTSYILEIKNTDNQTVTVAVDIIYYEI